MCLSESPFPYLQKWCWMHEAGHSKLVLWDTPEGWGGDRGGRAVQDGGTYVQPGVFHVNVWQDISKIL